MAHNQITVDRLRLFGALRRSRKQFAQDIAIINKIMEKLKEDKDSHYLSVSQEDFNSVSYAKRKDDKFDNDKRIKTTFGRYVRRRMKIKEDKLSDATLSDLATFISLAIGKKKNTDTETKKETESVNILSGLDIVNFYRKTDKTLHTCMTGARNSKSINFYAKNPNKVSLVVSKDEKSRALLWTADNGDKVLDKIYPKHGVGNKKIQIWASGKGFKKPNKTQRITMNHNGWFPYIDSFVFGKLDPPTASKNVVGTVILSTDSSFGNASFKSQHGSYTAIRRCSGCNVQVGMYEGTSIISNGKTIYFCRNCIDKHCDSCFKCKSYYLKSNNEVIEHTDKVKALLNKVKPPSPKLRKVRRPRSNVAEVNSNLICKHCLKKGERKTRECFLCHNKCSDNKCLVVLESNFNYGYLCYDCLKFDHGG